MKAPGSAIASLVANGRIEEARWPDFSDARSTLDAFYQMNSFAPAWVVKGAPNAQSMLLIDTLGAAAAKGLDPEDYDASKWPARGGRTSRDARPLRGTGRALRRRFVGRRAALCSRGALGSSKSRDPRRAAR
jgi:hypothetical protein